MLDRVKDFFTRLFKSHNTNKVDVGQLTMHGFWQKEHVHEKRLTDEWIKINLLPPGITRLWTGDFSTETPPESLKRTGWTKCHNCQDWFLRRVTCSGCGESNDIYPNCPHCEMTIKQLPDNWQHCQTCSTPLGLKDTTKMKAEPPQ